MHVTIVHPDLGIGGAERLVLDAAIAIRRNGHRVHFVTNHYTPEHAFAETTEFGKTQTTAMADLICVNSEFTKETAYKTFPILRGRRLHILYPTLNTEYFDSAVTAELNEIPEKARHIFLSVNRYERKKNIALALEAFDRLRKLISERDYQYCFLVIAGGYDVLNLENIAHFNELRELATALRLPAEQYLLLKSPTDAEKLELLRRATAVLYTPSNEHFGIVPVEAMYMKCCVIAPNSGGPRETVVNHETGFLVNADADSFAEKMAELIRDERKAVAMGEAGRKRVLSNFTMENFSEHLETLMRSVVQQAVI